MYLSYYGLARRPFEVAPDDEPIFDTPVHTDAVWNTIYGITEERGYIAIIGEAGSGKTTVLRAAVRSLKETHPSLIWVDCRDPAITPEALLAVLVDRLNLPFALTSAGDLGPFRNRLLRLRETGKSLVIVFDQAENISAETLAFLGRLSALDRDEAPLFLILFAARPSFTATLERPENTAIGRRIGSSIVLSPLALRVAERYLTYRITQSGGRIAEIMTPSAVRAIIKHAGGNPGRIHVLADSALQKGLASGHIPITGATVRAALSGLEDRASRPSGEEGAIVAKRTRLMVGAILGVAIAIAVLLAVRPWSAPRAFGPPSPITATVTKMIRPPIAPATVKKPTTNVASNLPSPPSVTHPQAAPSPRASPEPQFNPALPAMRVTIAPSDGSTMTYRIKRGETLLAIMRALSLPTTDAELRKIQVLNPTIHSLSVIFPGQMVVLPKSKS